MKIFWKIWLGLILLIAAIIRGEIDMSGSIILNFGALLIGSVVADFYEKVR